eukprot:15220957-Ditylum_brightwellii.AAC.1
MEKVQIEEEERNRDDSSVDSDSSDEEGDEVDGNGKEDKVQEGIGGDGEIEHPHKNMNLPVLRQMMIHFQGRSVETNHMKNKPIGGGFKFFTLTTTNECVANFTPDGRTAAKTGHQEYLGNSADGKIETM